MSIKCFACEKRQVLLFYDELLAVPHVWISTPMQNQTDFSRALRVWRGASMQSTLQRLGLWQQTWQEVHETLWALLKTSPVKEVTASACSVLNYWNVCELSMELFHWVPEAESSLSLGSNISYNKCQRNFLTFHSLLVFKWIKMTCNKFLP